MAARICSYYGRLAPPSGSGAQEKDDDRICTPSVEGRRTTSSSPGSNNKSENTPLLPVLLGTNSPEGIEIFLACRLGSLELVQKLVTSFRPNQLYPASEIDPMVLQTTDVNGRIPLHEACLYSSRRSSASSSLPSNKKEECVASQGNPKEERLAMIRYIIAHFPGGLAKKDMDQNLPIHEACRAGNAEVVQCLLQYKNTGCCQSGLASRNIFGHMLVHVAAAGGFTNVVNALLQHDATQTNGLRQFDKDGRLPLHHASASGNLGTVRRLLHGFSKRGVFQSKDHLGMYPLHHACVATISSSHSSSSNHNGLQLLELVIFLLEQYPNAVFYRDQQDRLPIDIIRQGRRRQQGGQDEAVAAGTSSLVQQQVEKVLAILSDGCDDFPPPPPQDGGGPTNKFCLSTEPTQEHLRHPISSPRTTTRNGPKNKKKNEESSPSFPDESAIGKDEGDKTTKKDRFRLCIVVVSHCLKPACSAAQSCCRRVIRRRRTNRVCPPRYRSPLPPNKEPDTTKG